MGDWGLGLSSDSMQMDEDISQAAQNFAFPGPDQIVMAPPPISYYTSREYLGSMADAAAASSASTLSTSMAMQAEQKGISPAIDLAMGSGSSSSSSMDSSNRHHARTSHHRSAAEAILSQPPAIASSSSASNHSLAAQQQGKKKNKRRGGSAASNGDEAGEKDASLKARHKKLKVQTRQRSSIERAVLLWSLKFADATNPGIDFEGADVNKALVRGALGSRMLRESLSKCFELPVVWPYENNADGSLVVDAAAEAVVEEAASLLPQKDTAKICKCIVEKRAAALEASTLREAISSKDDELTQLQGAAEQRAREIEELRQAATRDAAELKRLRDEADRQNQALQEKELQLKLAGEALDLERNTRRIAAEQNRDRCFVLVGHYNAEASSSSNGEGGGTISDIAEGVRASLTRFFANAAPPVAISAPIPAPAAVEATAAAPTESGDVPMRDEPAAAAAPEPVTIQVSHDENGVPVFGASSR